MLKHRTSSLLNLSMIQSIMSYQMSGVLIIGIVLINMLQSLDNQKLYPRNSQFHIPHLITFITLV